LDYFDSLGAIGVDLEGADLVGEVLLVEGLGELIAGLGLG
jgi:hypothetical protein